MKIWVLCQILQKQVACPQFFPMTVFLEKKSNYFELKQKIDSPPFSDLWERLWIFHWIVCCSGFLYEREQKEKISVISNNQQEHIYSTNCKEYQNDRINWLNMRNASWHRCKKPSIYRFIFIFWVFLAHLPASLSQKMCEELLPCGRGDHGLQPGYASIHRNHKVDVVKRHRSGHGFSVVFIIYPKVGVDGVTSPTHSQVQRSGLNPLSWHLKGKHREECVNTAGEFNKMNISKWIKGSLYLIFDHIHIVVRCLRLLFSHFL